MNKRVFSLVLACCLVCGCMIVPAYASELDPDQQQFLNVLEYATPNDSGNFYLTTDSSGVASAKFKMPFGFLLRYVDMYVASSRAINSANLVVGSTNFPLTIEAVSGTTYYRIYGSFSGSYTETFTLMFDTGVSNHFMQFFSLNVSPQALSAFSSPSSFTLENESVMQSYGSDLVSIECILNDWTYGALPWTSSVRNFNWTKYDYMTFTLSYYTATINSIAVQIAGRPVPYTVNYFENVPEYNGALDESIGLSDASAIYSVNITVDLSGVNRTQDADLIITVTGTGTSVYASLHNCSGYNVAALPDAELTWLQKINSSLDVLRNYVFGIRERFDSLLDMLSGNTELSGAIKDEVSSNSQELDNMGASMESLKKPEYIDTNIPDIQNVDTFLSGLGISYIIGSPYILPLVTASMILCFASYALFGKKG